MFATPRSAKRRKWIRRNFRFGICQYGEQSGFARVREADEPDIGDQLQFQFDPFLLGRFPFFLPYAAPGSARSQNADFLDHRAPPLRMSTVDPLSRIADERPCSVSKRDGPGWNIKNQMISLASRHLRGTAFDAIFGFELLILAECRKCIECGFNLKDDITALAAVATIRSAQWDKFLTTEMHHAVAALA